MLAAIAWAKDMRLSKVYLETYRDNFTAPSTILRDASAAFRAAGFVVHGCVCTTQIGTISTDMAMVSNYAVEATQRATAEILRVRPEFS